MDLNTVISIIQSIKDIKQFLKSDFMSFLNQAVESNSKKVFEYLLSQPGVDVQQLTHTPKSGNFVSLGDLINCKQ